MRKKGEELVLWFILLNRYLYLVLANPGYYTIRKIFASYLNFFSCFGSQLGICLNRCLNPVELCNIGKKCFLAQLKRVYVMSTLFITVRSCHQPYHQVQPFLRLYPLDKIFILICNINTSSKNN